MSNYKHKKILILGDAGRGKTTFAEKLSRKIAIPHYSTDDFFWKVKYTLPNDREGSVKEISSLYANDEWIVEGTTRRLIIEGLEKSDIIYYLKFDNIINQYYFIITRSLKRKKEKFIDLWRLLKHVTYKKYKKGYGGYAIPLNDLLSPYKGKIIELKSMKDINKCIDDIGCQ